MKNLRTIIAELEVRIDRIAYKPRLKRQRKLRGPKRIKSRKYYRRNKSEIKRRMKHYRKKFKTFLKNRRKKIHHKRL